MSTNFSELESAVEQSAENNDSANDDEQREEHAWVNVAPTTILTGTIRDVIWTGRTTNDDGTPVEQQSYDNGTDGSWGFILDDPGVAEGTIFKNAGVEDDDTLAREVDGITPTDYKVFDTEDDNFSKNYDSEGNLKGVSNHLTDEFNGREISEFRDDTIVVFTGSLAGQFMTRTLDVNGGQSAYITEDGNNTGGLIEYPSDWDNGVGDSGLYPRVANYPELREDLAGEEIFLALSWRNGSDRNMNGHVGLMSDLGEDPSADELSDALLGRVRNTGVREYTNPLAWHDSPVDGGSADEDDGESFDVGSTDSDDSSDDDSSGPDLTESQDQFVDDIIDQAMQSGDTVEDTFNDWGATVSEYLNKNVPDGDSGLPNTTDPDVLREVINDRNGGA